MIKALMVVASTVLALNLSGCATPAVTPPSSMPVTPPARAPSNRPADWIGRWHAPDGRFIQIMPTVRPGAYQLILGDVTGRETHLAGRASDGRLYFTRADAVLALRPGDGAETGFAALTGRHYCLIVVPGPDGYCRTPGTADALPLTPGAYAPVSQDCWAPTPADLVYFNGRELDTPASPRCASPVLGQTGVIFSLGSQCTSTSVGTASIASRSARVTVADDHRFALENAQGVISLYRYCPAAQLPRSRRPTADSQNVELRRNQP